MFKLHDHVIYPAHGVALVDEISEKKVGENSIQFLTLNFVLLEQLTSRAGAFFLCDE